MWTAKTNDQLFSIENREQGQCEPILLSAGKCSTGKTSYFLMNVGSVLEMARKNYEFGAKTKMLIILHSPVEV